MYKNEVSGIYSLSFPKEYGRFYIGKSTNLRSRTLKHLNLLRKGEHYNKKLTEAYDKYGDPEIFILEYVDVDKLFEREIFWIKELDGFTLGYNSTLGGENPGDGENHPLAQCTNDVYLSIARKIAYTSTPYSEIAKELGVSVNIVTNIANGNSHAWINSVDPELYSALINSKPNRSGDKYSKEKYVEILNKLANTNDNMVQISDDLNVTLSVVYEIYKEASHKYLKDEYPELYHKMQNRITGNRMYTIETYEKVFLRMVNTEDCLPLIEKEEGVALHVLKHIAECTGYKFLKEKYPKEWEILYNKFGNRRKGPKPLYVYPPVKSPTGEIYIVDNISKFCKEHSLDTSNFGNVLRGSRRMHKDWVLA